MVIQVRLSQVRRLSMNNKGPSYHSGNSKTFGRSMPRTMGKDQIYVFFIILQLVKTLEQCIGGRKDEAECRVEMGF